MTLAPQTHACESVNRSILVTLAPQTHACESVNRSILPWWDMCIRKPKHITLMKHHTSIIWVHVSISNVGFQPYYDAITSNFHATNLMTPSSIPCNVNTLHCTVVSHVFFPTDPKCNSLSHPLDVDMKKYSHASMTAGLSYSPNNGVIWLIGVVINRCHEPLLIMTVMTDLSCFTLECQPYHGIYFSPFMTSMNLSRFHSCTHGVWMRKLHWSWSNTHH